MSHSIQKNYYSKHRRPNLHHEGDLAQVYRPIPPPRTYRKFFHPWSRDSFRVVKALSPTNYLVRNAQLRTQPITVHHNKNRPYKGTLTVDYENSLRNCRRKPPDGIAESNQRGEHRTRRLKDERTARGERPEDNLSLVVDEQGRTSGRQLSPS